jgi:hypothetical protein
MSATIKFIDGNTQTLVSELPVEQASDTMRYVYFKQGVRTDKPEEADARIEIVKVVRFTFDEQGRLTPAEQAYNGFLKFFDANGQQVKESFIKYHPEAELQASNFRPGS